MSELKIKTLEEWKQELLVLKTRLQEEIDNALDTAKKLEIKAYTADQAKGRLGARNEVFVEAFVTPLFSELEIAEEKFKEIREENFKKIKQLDALIHQIEFDLEFHKVQ